MPTDYQTLCAELLAVFDSYDDESNLVGIFDDMKANKNDLLDRARAALAEPLPPADGEVAELVAWLREAAWHAGHQAPIAGRFFRAADLLERLVPEPEPKRPSDEELTLTYAYAVAAAVDNKQGSFKEEDVKAAQLAGLRTVLARWGHAPNA